MSGWAFVGCDICGLWKCAGGCTGSVQFRIDDGAQTGSCNFVFHTGSTISEPDTRLFLSGNLDVSGTINATNYNVINHTISYLSSSGDSKFGDTFGDLHQFTGALSVAAMGKGDPLLWVEPGWMGLRTIILGTDCADIVHVSGTLTASCGMHISGGLSISGTLDLCPTGTLKVSTIVACSPLSISASQVDVTSSIRISGSQQILFGQLGSNQSISGDESGNTLRMHAEGDLQFESGGDQVSWKTAAGVRVGEFALNSGDPGNPWIFRDSSATEVMRIDGATHSLFVTGNLRVCDGTASIAHLSGCSPIQVHAPLSPRIFILNEEVPPADEAEMGFLSLSGSEHFSADGSYRQSSALIFGMSLDDMMGDPGRPSAIIQVGSEEDGDIVGTMAIQVSGNAGQNEGVPSLILSAQGVGKDGITGSAEIFIDNGQVVGIMARGVQIEGDEDGNEVSFNVVEASSGDYNTTFHISGGTGDVMISGNLSVCNATASLHHVTGCSPITFYAPISASTITMFDTVGTPGGPVTLTDQIVIGPSFNPGGFAPSAMPFPGMISIPSSSHPMGLGGLLCWGSDGAYTSLPTAMIDHEGANFFAPTTPWATMGSSGPSASVSYEGVQLSGVVGDASGGPKIQVGSPFAGQSAVTIGPTFPPFAPNPGWAPGMILITSGNVCGVNIMPTGPGEPIAMYNAGGLFFSGSDTTSAVESDHPLVKADRLMTANAAISIGVIGDPDGPGGSPPIYQSGTMVIQSGTYNGFMIMGGDGTGPTIHMNPVGFNFSASSTGGAINIRNGALRFENPHDYSGSLAGAGSYMGLNSHGQMILTSAGAGSLAIGTAVGGAASNRVLFTDGSSQLQQNANFTFDGSWLNVSTGVQLGRTGPGNEVVTRGQMLVSGGMQFGISSSLASGGGIDLSYQPFVTTASINVTAVNRTYVVFSGSTALTATLGPIAPGRLVNIKRHWNMFFDVEIETAGGNQIDGATSLTLTNAGESVTLLNLTETTASIASHWHIF